MTPAVAPVQRAGSLTPAAIPAVQPAPTSGVGAPPQMAPAAAPVGARPVPSVPPTPAPLPLPTARPAPVEVTSAELAARARAKESQAVAAKPVALPANPDEITIAADLLWSFRLASMAGQAAFWAVAGTVFGLLSVRATATSGVTTAPESSAGTGSRPPLA